MISYDILYTNYNRSSTNDARWVSPLRCLVLTLFTACDMIIVSW